MVKSTAIGLTTLIFMTGSKYTMAELRRLEADLKRKSDLLSEVKVLLAQAAERERSLISERDEAKSKVFQEYMIKKRKKGLNIRYL